MKRAQCRKMLSLFTGGMPGHRIMLRRYLANFIQPASKILFEVGPCTKCDRAGLRMWIVYLVVGKSSVYSALIKDF